MRNDLLNKMETFLKNRKRRRIAQGVAAGLAVVMAVTTTNAMILPAISLEKNEAEKDAAIFIKETATASNAKTESGKEKRKRPMIVAETSSNSIGKLKRATSSDAIIVATSSVAQKVEQVYRDDEIEVIATYNESANIPEAAEFVVEKLELDEFPEETEKMNADTYMSKYQETEALREKKSLKKTLDDVEAFIKSFLNSKEEVENVDSESNVQPEAGETETEETVNIRLNLPEEGKKIEETELDDEEELGELPETYRYKIGFYLDGIEIEPQDTVSLSVRFFSGRFAEAEEIQVVHYLENHEDADTEMIDTEKDVDEEGNVRARFDMDSFSVVEFTAVGNIAALAGESAHIYFYVCLDNEWVLVKEDPNVTVTSFLGGYYISGSILEAAYGEYGYQASVDQHGKYLFGYAGHENDSINQNAQMIRRGNVIYSRIQDPEDGESDVFYLPVSGQKFQYTPQDKNAYLTTDTFYSVKMAETVEKYILTGTSDEVTVVNNTEGTLVAVGADGTVVRGTEGTDNTVTFSFNEISQPYVIRQEGLYSVTYDMDGTFEQAGSQYAPETQEWRDTDISVDGLDGTYEETSGTYQVRNISNETRVARAAYGNQGEILFTYHFVGWKRNDTGEIVAQGTEIEVSSDIILTAVWCVHFSHSEEENNNDLASVAFYLSIVTELGDNAGNQGYYTDCLYTTRVLEGKEWANQYSGSATPVCGDNTGGDYIRTDEQLREQAEIGIQNGNYIVQLEKMPSDDEIFGRIRTWGDRASDGTKTTIEINGKEYAAEDITADNFEIKWYVLKPSTFNTWHVDGKLVPREAKLTVTKTFIGDGDAIEKVTNAENGYQIIVTADSDTKSPYHLNLSKYDSGTNPYGYVEANGNTYTWVLEGLYPATIYQIKEENYAVEDYTATVSYQISQSRNGTNDTEGWISYSETSGITVNECYAYQDNVSYGAYQTVALRNVYTKPFVLTLIKQDGTTYHGLSGVEFKLILEKEGEDPVFGTVKSDASGNIVVNFLSFEDKVLGAGSYSFTLEEKKIDGYNSQITVSGQVEVSANGTVKAEIIKADVAGENLTAYVDSNNTSLIYIVNHSERTKVIVSKRWTDETNKPVTMQLLRNGAAVEGCVVELSSENDWTHTWEELPLYVDGRPADYGVQETWIGSPGADGSAHYTEQDDVDGYADYIVTQSAGKNDDGNTVITVNNTCDRGQAVFTKVNGSGESLKGAEFTVYTDKNCTTIAKYSVNGNEKDAIYSSDDSGVVTIEGLLEGTYYVKETKAPNGYVLGEKVYTLYIRKHNSSIAYGEETISQIVNEPIQVTLSFRKFTRQGESEVGLDGAEFSLYDSGNYGKYTQGDTSAATIDTWTSEAGNSRTPEAVFPIGEYYLVETKAPEGYHLLTGPVKITIKEDGSVTAEAQGTSNSMATAKENLGESYSWTISIENLAGLALPNTGGIGTIFNKFGGLLLMAGAVICGYILKRRRERRAVE